MFKGFKTKLSALKRSKSEQRKLRITFLLGILSGALAALSFAPFYVPLLAYLSLWPYFYFARTYRNRPFMLIASGLWISFMLCIFAYHWIVHTVHLFGGFSLFVSVLIFIPYSLFLNLKIPLFILLFSISLSHRVKRYMPPTWVTAGTLFVVVDLSAPQIFPWYTGNLIAGSSLWLSQVIEFTGVYFLSFIAGSLSYLLYRLLMIEEMLRTLEKSNRSRRISPLALFKLRFTYRPMRLFRVRRLATTFPFFIFVFILVVWGAYRASSIEQEINASPKIYVAALQPNTPINTPTEQRLTVEKLQYIMNEKIPMMAEHAALASKGRLDLIVLPESAVPFYSADPLTDDVALYNPHFDTMARLLAYNWGADVFLNETTARKATHPFDSGAVRLESYNSSVIYGRDLKRIETYDKRILVAFGEYYPPLDLLEDAGMLPSSWQGGRFFPGRSSNSLPFSTQNSHHPIDFHKLRDIKLTEQDVQDIFPSSLPEALNIKRKLRRDGTFIPLICYEILMPEHIRTFFANGKNPSFMVNITQDGWYGHGVESYQHFELGRLRAIEFRRAVVRSTNSGVSGMVDPVGRFAPALIGPALTPQDEEAVQVWAVPLYRGEPTFYARYGSIWMVALIPIFFMPALKRSLRLRKRALPQKKK